MFDKTDRRILNLLQGDAEIPIAEIAAEVGLSPSPCWRRIKRMEQSGLIRRKVVLVDRAKANVPLTVFVGVRVPSHSIEWLESFRRVIADIPEIVEAYRLTGENRLSDALRRPLDRCLRSGLQTSDHPA